jgi:hypothetical protein
MRVSHPHVVAWCMRKWYCISALVVSLKVTLEVTFVSGYVIWNINNVFCAELRVFRNVVGNPLGFVTKLHGW